MDIYLIVMVENGSVSYSDVHELCRLVQQLVLAIVQYFMYITSIS